MTSTVRRRRWDTDAVRVAPAVALAAVTVATAASLCRVFVEWSFMPAALGVAMVAHLTSGVGRGLGWRGARAAAVTIAAVGTAITWLHMPETLRFGLPTADTVHLARDELATTWGEVGVAVPPLEFADGFALVALISIGLAAIVADAVAFRTRSRVEALLAPGIVFVAVSAVGMDRFRVGVTAVWLATALMYAATTRSAEVADEPGWVGRPRTAGRSVSISGIGLALVVAGLAAVIAPRLPSADAEPLLEPRVRPSSSAGAAISPLVDIRGRLTDRSDTILFSVRADRSAYWRVVGVSEFDGNIWRLPTDELSGAGGTLDNIRPFGEPLRQTVRIAGLKGNLVPVAASPTDLRSSGVDLFYAGDSGTLVVADPGLDTGAEYEIVSSVPRPPLEILRTATSTAPRPAYTDLPASWNPELTAVARAVTAGSVGPYAQALALQNWFRNDFTYDLDVRLGTSIEAIETFIGQRRGYCEQFAGTFAALARSLGLPARVAIGFTPGDLGADGIHRVRSRHAHAWPEVWFDGLGWISFEPTPGRGEPGAESRTGVSPAQVEDRGSTSTTTVAPAPPPPVLATPGAAPDLGVLDTEAIVEARRSSPAPLRWLALVILVVIAWTIVMPAVVTRRVRAADGDQRILDDWNASITAMGLAGVHVDPSATPRETAQFIARHSGLDRQELNEIATAATYVLYGVGPLDEPSRQRSIIVGRHIRESAMAVVPVSWKCRARLDPRVAARLVRG
jgi:transglutaminase-like putative cysteine protease